MDARTKELVTGGGIAGFGGITIALTIATLPIGTLRAAGPGLFPISMGVVLVFLGLVIFGGAVIGRVGPQIYTRKPDWRSLILISLSIMTFIFGFKYLGLLAGVFLSTVVASFADHKLPFSKAVILGVGLSLLAGLIFRVALGMQMPLLINPFGS